MKTILLLLSAALLCGCGYDRFAPPETTAGMEVRPNVDIAAVRKLYSGKAVTVNAAMAVGGWVVANDRSGNFYRSFIIDDGTGAVEIRAALYDLYTSYPEGRYLVVDAGGMTLGSADGVLQLGLGVYGNTTSPDYICYPAIMRDRIMSDGSRQIWPPETVEAGVLSDGMCGRLVKIGGLTLDDGQSAVWDDGDGYSSVNYRRFSDSQGRSISVAVSDYADFAHDTIPAGRVAVTGILMYGKAAGKMCYILKPRYGHDIVEM